MSTPTDKIAAGLAKRQTSSAPTSIHSLYGAPASLSQLSEAAHKITSKRNKLKNLSEAVRKAIETQRAEIEERYKELGVIREGRLITRTIPENTIRGMIEREVAKVSRAARQTTSDERSKLLAEVRELKAKIESVKDAWSHPVTILDRKTRNSQDRAVIAGNLTGVASIVNALRDAITTGSAPLAMAALMAAEKLSKESRRLVPYSARDVAEAIPNVRDEFTRANQFIAMSAWAAEESELANAEAEGLRSAAEMKMRVGRLRNEMEALGGEPEADDKSEPTPAKPESKPEPVKIDTSKYTISDQEWEAMLEAARADA